MLWVALLLAVGWAVTVALFVRASDRARREHARREDLLVNQLCSLAGRPWQQPPAFEDTLPKPEPDPWVSDAEQEIVA